jgi:hypothetical protein
MIRVVSIDKPGMNKNSQNIDRTDREDFMGKKDPQNSVILHGRYTGDTLSCGR